MGGRLNRRTSNRLAAFTALLAVWVAPVAVGADKDADLPVSEIARIGREATAFVEVEPGRSASAFCVHPSGLFVTNHHVVQWPTGGIKVVVNSGTLEQKVFTAKVVRRDKDADLALLRVENGGGLPTLSLGSAGELSDLMDVIAFGFPFGRGQATGVAQYPSISINRGSISSLRRKEGRLDRIQLNAALNPGNSGGPLLSAKGRVVGVIVGRVEGPFGAGIDLAIPVNVIDAFLSRPEIDVTPPRSDTVGTNEPVEFKAKAVTLIPTKLPLDLQLVLGVGTPLERRTPMALTGVSYAAKVVPFPTPSGKVKVAVVVKYADGSVSGLTDDQPVNVGLKSLNLSQFRTILLGPKPQARLSDDRTAVGAPVPPKDMAVTVGGQTLRLDLTRAASIDVTDNDDIGAVSCSVVALRGSDEVGRVSTPVYLRGAVRPSAEALREGRFIKPARSPAPLSYLRVESSPGDFIGQGKTYSYEKDDLNFQPGIGVLRCQIGNFGGFTLMLGAGQGRNLDVGEYRDAKRQPFSGASPGIDFNGNGRGCNMISGEFRVWEIETRGNEVVRLAVDFVQRCEERQPPLVGMLRCNSSYF
jgi:hypothetical protein